MEEIKMKKLLFIPAILAMVTVGCNKGNTPPHHGPSGSEWSEEVQEDMMYYLGEVLPYVELDEESMYYGYNSTYRCYVIGDDNEEDLMTGYGELLEEDDWTKDTDSYGDECYVKGELTLYADYYEEDVDEETGETIPAGNEIAVYGISVTPEGDYDLLDADCFDATSTAYVDSEYTAESGATYLANTAVNSNGAIQMRSKNNHSGIVCSVSVGIVAAIAVEFDEENTSDGRTINIYGSNEAYTSPADLYESDANLVGTIVFGDGSDEDGIYYYTFEDEYAYFGLRSKKDALFCYQIAIFWE